ncbi:MAG: hypothetical protein DI588_08930 [Flavobacterium johnsoniae]|nr:MAG: hypothetical protein DI588_08930 [Flavobacterium johnsoniae]
MEDFFDSNAEYEIRIFQIDKLFYEFRDCNTVPEIIQLIVDTHRRKLNPQAAIGIPIPVTTIDEVLYYTYVYNEEQKESHWANFLPSQITQNQTFTIQQLSLVMFAEVGDYLFAFVGGTGIWVISRYINYRFGLEFYEYLADLQNDIVNFITTRGISGKLSQNSETFRDGQNLGDTLNFTNIPTKINLLLREDLINTVFDFVQFNTDKVYVEVASYFCVKARVTFYEIHQILKKIAEIVNTGTYTPLTSFVLVKDTYLINNIYRFELYQRIRQDMFDRLTPSSAINPPKFDIDFIHPSKLQDFYECDRYEVFARGAQSPIYSGNDRGKLYVEGLKYLYNNYNPVTFNYLLSGIRVYGFKGNTQKTHAMFTQHITCELSINGLPIFLIDSNYYQVKNDFVLSINRMCQDMLNKNYLRENILALPWPTNMKEGPYNDSYEQIPGFRVFDKVLSQNIELCDLFFEDDNSVYFIHVKKGFDAKIRDLSNQIVISSTRFWNDKNSGTFEFLDTIIDGYNADPNNTEKNIVRADFLNSINTKEIFFVMAFKSTLRNNEDIRQNVASLRSNIAKYSLIQCVRDMNTNMYPIKLFDVAYIS